MAQDIQFVTAAGRVVGARLCNFGNDSEKPLATHETWIKKFLAPALKARPGASIDLIGMASRNGDPTYNTNLSRRRIAQVENLIKQYAGKVTIGKRDPRGEHEAEEDGMRDGNRDGLYRAVRILWPNLPLKIDPLPPEPPPPEPKERLLVAPPGCWLIIGVDTIGVPVKAGISAGKIVVTILNDKGEQFELLGAGVGAGAGANFLPESEAKGIIVEIVSRLKEMGLKPADIPNIHQILKDFSFPSSTQGGIFKRATFRANLTLEDITKWRAMTIFNGEFNMLFGGEVGVITFFNFGLDPISQTIGLGRLVAGTPWGFYSSVGVGKLSIGVGETLYVILRVKQTKFI